MNNNRTARMGMEEGIDHEESLDLSLGDDGGHGTVTAVSRGGKGNVLDLNEFVFMKAQLIKKYSAIAFGLALAFQTNAQSQSRSPTNAQINSRKAEAEAAKIRAYSEQDAEGRIKTVIRVGPPFLSGSRLTCFVGLLGHTNVIAYKPLPSQAFDASLFAPNGKAVSKTWAGRKFGKSPKVDDELKDPMHHTIMNYLRDERTLDFDRGTGDYHIWDFDILKSFRIKKAGEYRLQVQVRLFAKDTNGMFQPFILPPVETKVQIKESDLDK